MHEGHRERMLKKIECYSNCLTEHEWLEILLYSAVPRINTNPLAHRLLDRFGSIGGVFDASVQDLQGVKGVGKSMAAYLRTLGIFYEKYREGKAGKTPKKFDEHFEEYLTKYYALFSYEVLSVFFLDSKNNILQCKTFTSRSDDRVFVSPAEIMRCIATNACYGIVLAHNHIGADEKPSLLDDDFTKQCEILFSMNNIRLYDHLIVSGEDVYSYYRSGKMADIAQEFHVQLLVRE